METATWSWTAEDLHPTSPITMACRAWLTPLLTVTQKLRHALAIRTRRDIPSRRYRTPRLSCPYAMLVESDVQPGMRGILP